MIRGGQVITYLTSLDTTNRAFTLLSYESTPLKLINYPNLLIMQGPIKGISTLPNMVSLFLCFGLDCSCTMAYNSRVGESGLA